MLAKLVLLELVQMGFKDLSFVKIDATVGNKLIDPLIALFVVTFHSREIMPFQNKKSSNLFVPIDDPSIILRFFQLLDDIVTSRMSTLLGVFVYIFKKLLHWRVLPRPIKTIKTYQNLADSPPCQF